MNSEMRRARALALLLDLLIPVAAADAVGLILTTLLWRIRPASPFAAAAIWAAVAGGALAIFLLRDASGGRARRWFALEARDAQARPPGPWGSIRRNLPLLIPGWNLFEVWPVLRDGSASRRSDRRRGTKVVPLD
jgi:hypothetical protein